MEQFHHARQIGEHGSAMFLIDKALQTPEYRPEALIWKGIEALQQQRLHHAFLFLGSAAQALPGRADVRALAGRSALALQQPELATRLLAAAWQQMPTDPGLRIMLWHARSQSMPPAKLRRLIFTHLPEIDDAAELGLVLKMLAAQPEAPAEVGVARFDPQSNEITGWAVSLRSPASVVSIQIESGGQRITHFADLPHPLLSKAGICEAHGGLRVRVADPAPTLHVRCTDGTPLIGSPLSNLPPFNPSSPVGKKTSRLEPVDILVPVYDGYEETLECINSVLRNRSLNRTAHRLIVLDDATPNAELRTALQRLADDGQIQHIQHASNLGFIRNVNRGMALHTERDVVWLNADTRVHGNWLDRLRAVAYSDKDIASVTPFTNNGELMSFPVSRVSHTMPTAEQQADLDQLAQTANAAAMEIETGCGFCLYIKRDAITEVGYLDEVHLLRGYGEETDWCLRARSLGWRHMGAPNVFVAHQGGISFGEEKSLRVAHNNAILKRRYPNASDRYQAFCLRDPIKPARQALQRARINHLSAHLAAAAAEKVPGLKSLHIHGADVDESLSLTWRHQASHTMATVRAKWAPLDLALEYRLPEDADQLVTDLRGLPLEDLVYRQLTGCPAELLTLAARLDKPYRIRCRDDELLAQRADRGWREFARQAQSVSLPWQALRQRYAAALPNARIVIDKNAKAVRAKGQAPHTLLIADDLRDAEIAGRWIDFARSVTRDNLPVVLLADGDHPWLKTLIATGAVHALPEVQGLDKIDCLSLTGCDAALSLEAAPGAGWSAPDLASTIGLPLYAVTSAVAKEAGALPMNHLPFSLSRA
ncbi:MAG: glycosyltransferase family 2 protein [Pseudomonas graminis]